MEKRTLSWRLGYTREPEREPARWMDAQVPGSVQADYARDQGWEPFWKGTHVSDYGWMEDVYWLYRTTLDFSLKPGQRASLVFTAIDYRYTIRAGSKILWDGEGMFTPVRCDVTALAGQGAEVEVLIHPVPKAVDAPTRDQAKRSTKAAACYGWDWHPRLVTAGIWDETYLLIEDSRCVTDWQLSYTLSDGLEHCTVRAQVCTGSDCPVQMQILDGERVVTCDTLPTRSKTAEFTLTLEEPKLWYPVGYGQQHRYRVVVSTLDDTGAVVEQYSRSLGLRRARLVMNTGGWAVPGYPKTRANAPITVEINGIRIFAKGSNWVNAQVFPGEMNDRNYGELLHLVRDCNMNMVRVWGGGFVNKEGFYDLCDALGILVWQEFPLACNEYPDEDGYLAVLEQEATAVVRRLRTHPSVVLWCGGNELFNSWSGMTEQHHALRLLDSICYREDRFTPFIMTAPLNGMAHGNYINVDHKTGQEAITALCKCRNTAYSEFGSPAIASRETLLSFMRQEDLADCRPENPVWREHFGFGAGGWENRWVCKEDVEFYFGGWQDLDDFIEKSQFIQAMTYRSMFEEARRQWPLCSMALNWCLNEPWPTAANCSILEWPAKPKAAYHAVAQALRPRTVSLAVNRHLWYAGETFCARVWLLNDAMDVWEPGRVTLYYDFGEGEVCWGELCPRQLEPQTNSCLAEVSLPIPKDFAGMLRLRLTAELCAMAESTYRFPCRRKNEPDMVGFLNVD